MSLSLLRWVCKWPLITKWKRGLLSEDVYPGGCNIRPRPALYTTRTFSPPSAAPSLLLSLFCRYLMNMCRDSRSGERWSDHEGGRRRSVPSIRRLGPCCLIMMISLEPDTQNTLTETHTHTHLCRLPSGCLSTRRRR